MYNIIRNIYRVTIKPVYKGILILRSWIIIISRILIIQVLRSQKTDHYCVKTGYVSRRENVHFNDINNKDEHQDEVYKRIKEFFLEHHLESIIDIGCGSGYKLIKYFGESDIVGLELQPALDHLLKSYPDRNWIYSDFSFLPVDRYDLVISIDVIEHLVDPDKLMEYISKLNPKYVAFSTPDRNKLPYQSRLGPPINIAHIREWSELEFNSLYSKAF